MRKKYNTVIQEGGIISSLNKKEFMSFVSHYRVLKREYNPQKDCYCYQNELSICKEFFL